jgi:flavin reductase (DIM6/NTAB) family NADH-FMN oxidoreductase RutF
MDARPMGHCTFKMPQVRKRRSARPHESSRMKTDPTYELLREFASPVVAITSACGGRTNGMISDSAVRASISPKVPRLAVQVHKWHLSHEFIWESGLFAIHLLHRGQFELVHRLGFVSGRDKDKLAEVPHRTGVTGVPVLDDCYAAFECRVINTMDVGYATNFLGDVVQTTRGKGEEVMTAGFFRSAMPVAWRDEFLANYQIAQEVIEREREIKDVRWKGREK